MPLGLYLSRCGGDVDRVLDLDALAARFAAETAAVRVVDDFFDPAFDTLVGEDIRSLGLDAIVLAGESGEQFNRALSAPFTVQRIVDAGVNPNRVAHANLREQVALACAGDGDGAAAKAEAIVAEAVMRSTTAAAVEPAAAETRSDVLVLGASPAGLVAAQRMLRLGHPVVIADRGDVASRAGQDASLRATASFVLGDPGTTRIDEASIADADGWVGDFGVAIEGRDGLRTLKVGGILLAEPDAEAWASELRAHFPLDVDDDGRVQAHEAAAHPAETGEPGVMLVPDHATGDLREVVAAADTAVMALVLDLTSPASVRHTFTSSVDETLCGACASCVKTCAFGACSIDAARGVSVVDVRRCHGCGKCVVSCPVGARDIVSAPHDHLMAAIRLLANTSLPAPRVLGMLCGGCGYPAADRAGAAVADGAEPYPASFLPLRINCGGRLDALYVLEAFRAGFDGVAVFRCREGRCRNRIGNLDMDRRINLLRTVLRSRGLDDGRLRIVDITSEEGGAFIAEVNGFFAALEAVADGKGGAR